MSSVVGLLSGYTAGDTGISGFHYELTRYNKAMFIVYSVAPLLFRMASSSYFNMALLTSDFYGLLFGKLSGRQDIFT
jgi:hypothetical protein